MIMTLNKIIFSVISLMLISSIATAETAADIDKWILNQMHEYNIPGCSIAVIKNYKIKWVKGYGVRDKMHNKPVNADTLFQAASISKPITAVATVITFKE